MSDNITGSLQVKKGFYYAVINLTGPDGKRKQRWISTGYPEKGNKRRAAQRMREIIEELEDQNVTFDSSMKFYEALEMWLEASKLRIRESTYRNYKTVMDAHIIPYFKESGIKLRDLRPYHLEEYYRFRSIMPISIVRWNTPARISSSAQTSPRTPGRRRGRKSRSAPSIPWTRSPS